MLLLSGNSVLLSPCLFTVQINILVTWNPCGLRVLLDRKSDAGCCQWIWHNECSSTTLSFDSENNRGGGNGDMGANDSSITLLCLILLKLANLLFPICDACVCSDRTWRFLSVNPVSERSFPCRLTVQTGMLTKLNCWEIDGKQGSGGIALFFCHISCNPSLQRAKQSFRAHRCIGLLQRIVWTLLSLRHCLQ